MMYQLSALNHILAVIATLLASICITQPADGRSYFPRIIPTPPTMPPQFSISFAEIETLSGKVLSTNNGTWYYDWAHRRARYDHGEGQTNNFCDGQGLSPKDPKAPCSLIFTPDEKLYVLYPQSMTCCLLCGKEQGCTILRPDWIRNGSKLLSVEMINGHKCYGYGKPGAVAADDILYSDIGGDMCRYSEVVASITHNLTFYRESFKVGEQPDYLFDIPEVCIRTCPHPYHPPHW